MFLKESDSMVPVLPILVRYVKECGHIVDPSAVSLRTFHSFDSLCLGCPAGHPQLHVSRWRLHQRCAQSTAALHQESCVQAAGPVGLCWRAAQGWLVRKGGGGCRGGLAHRGSRLGRHEL